MATEREGSSYTRAPAAVNGRHLCLSTLCSHGLNMEGRGKKKPGSGMLFHTYHSDLCHLYKYETAVCFLLLSLSTRQPGMTHERTANPIHLQRVHNNPPSALPPLPIPHYVSARLQHKSATTASVSAISKSSSL